MRADPVLTTHEVVDDLDEESFQEEHEEREFHLFGKLPMELQ